MTTIHGRKKLIAVDIMTLLVLAHQIAQSYAPNTKGKVHTKIEAFGTGEDEKGNVRVWAEVSFHEDD